MLWPSWACRTSCGHCICLVSCSTSLIKRWLVRRSASISFVLSCIVSSAPAGGRLLSCLVGLASLGDWRGSCLYSKLIPSVTERSTLFVKELSFPHTTPTSGLYPRQDGPSQGSLEVFASHSETFGTTSPLELEALP